ncbi:uncharacterized protein LOC121725466 [Aricia agestis]|uniref:uncharacterized protein LOC121725466 n=1 Tax=Aricia agestis TaxID=91739 RepID=UPI001C204016|nr:uncharacterized protein LOC121725466 [Aricia agestis]
MEVIPKNEVLQTRAETLDFLRKQYNLDKKIIHESINLLEEWLKKQQHFVDKDLGSEYLERALILAKGSVEKVKKKLDRLCTYRTLLPKYFEQFDADICRDSKYVIDGLLPKLTSDHYRVYFLKMVGGKPDDLQNYYRWCTAMFEYLHTYDYCSGLIVIFDYTEADVLDIVKRTDIVDVHNLIRILVEGFGVRLKGFHIVSDSKVMNIVVSFFRQAASAKIAHRVTSHKDFDSIFQIVPKEILPAEYGGNCKSIHELHLDWVNVLSSPKFSAHLQKMKSMCTNEDLRQKDTFNNECMGMPGTFRTLCLD